MYDVTKLTQQSSPYLCWVDPLNTNKKGWRLTRLSIGVIHFPLKNITKDLFVSEILPVIPDPVTLYKSI